MLINCPRCGFSQPNDQYCAQCGVDMATYKPKIVPTSEKIFKSSLTHIFILLVLSLFVGQYIIHNEEPQTALVMSSKNSNFKKNKNNETIASQDNSIANQDKNTDQNSEKNPDKNPDKNPEQKPDTQLNKIEKNTLAASGDISQTLDSIKNEELKIEATTSSSTSPSEINSVNFKITYAEISTSLISKWINESSNAGQLQSQTDHSIGVLNDFRKKMDSGFQSLKASEKKLSLGQADTQLSGSVNEDGTSIMGLATHIEFKSIENNLLRGSVLINRNSKLSSDAFPSDFELPKGSALFIVGILKQNSYTQAEKKELSMPPFQIFKSIDFMTQKTEFVIVIEPDYK